jgi:hypothetical protein
LQVELASYKKVENVFLFLQLKVLLVGKKAFKLLFYCEFEFHGSFHGSSGTDPEQKAAHIPDIQKAFH